MSALLSPVELEQPNQAPKLRSVSDHPGRLASVPFLLILALMLGSGMAGVLLVNTAIQDRSVQLRQLQRQDTTLGYQEASLQTEVDRLRSAASLAQLARSLGMVPNPYSVFLQLPDGMVIGQPKSVMGGELPAQNMPLPTASAAANPKATETAILAEATPAADGATPAAADPAAPVQATAEHAVAETDAATAAGTNSPAPSGQPAVVPATAGAR